MKRVILIVLDSVGIGALPDAARYGDEGTNTLVHIQKQTPSLHLKNLCRLGLSWIDGEEIPLLGQGQPPIGCYGKMAEASAGKDTTTGHWELCGIKTASPFPTFTEIGFPPSMIQALEKRIGRKTLGNYAASGTEIIRQLGDEHIKTGFPIVYTSADSVFQIAAHEDVIPLAELYHICETARALLTGSLGVARVIARPFTGTQGAYTRTENRRDFSLPPTAPTLLDDITRAGHSVYAVGKIEDIFCRQGITVSCHTRNNQEGIEQTLAFMQEPFGGLLFTNLVDFDMLYGHRNDVSGYASALAAFDAALPAILAALSPDDILFITADHGCDPTMPGTDHTREYVPVLAYGKPLKPGINLGVRSTYADLGKTIAEYLEIPASFSADSFLSDLVKGGINTPHALFHRKNRLC